MILRNMFQVGPYKPQHRLSFSIVSAALGVSQLSQPTFIFSIFISFRFTPSLGKSGV